MVLIRNRIGRKYSSLLQNIAASIILQSLISVAIEYTMLAEFTARKR